MFVVLLCHRKKSSVNRGAFRAHWRNRRRNLVHGLHPMLGFARYSQLHRTSRLNPLYLAVLFSRSWPFVALFAALQGLPLPTIFAPAPRSADERWDAVETFWYASRADATAALTSQAAIDALKRLTYDARAHVYRSIAVPADELVVADTPDGPSPPVVTMFCLRAPSRMTRAQMLDYWRESHWPLVLSLQSALNYRRYAQLHVRDAAELQSPSPGSDSDAAAPYDGVAVLGHQSQWDLVRGAFNPLTQLANLKLVRDETRFIDHQRSVLVFGREATIENNPPEMSDASAA